VVAAVVAVVATGGATTITATTESCVEN
jgi:hypothetical protein